MTKDKESPYLTKRHPLYGITLYSLDGNTWSTNPSELPVIQDRLEKGLVGSIDKRMIPPRKRPVGRADTGDAPSPVLAEEDEEPIEDDEGTFDEEVDDEEKRPARPATSRTKQIGDALRSLGDELGLNEDDVEAEEAADAISAKGGSAAPGKKPAVRGSRPAARTALDATPVARAAAPKPVTKVTRENTTAKPAKKKVEAPAGKGKTTTTKAPAVAVPTSKAKSAPSKRGAAVKAPVVKAASPKAAKSSSGKIEKSGPSTSTSVKAKMVKAVPAKTAATKAAPAKAKPKNRAVAPTPAKSGTVKNLKRAESAASRKKGVKTAPQKKGGASSKGSKRK